MIRRFVVVSAVVLSSCAPATRLASQSGPRTRAERSGYTETSTHADVLAFLDSLDARGLPIRRGSVGRTTEGRDIPFVIASRPLFATPEEARASGRPIVYVQGNIHAGEVEGKEALQALLRDLLLTPRRNVLDSIVLIAVPIYNADGNERFDNQARNRGAQNGPEMVGQRPNALGLDLNRDYIKADAPETRASLAMFNRWDPHLFVDLHTTNGSYHGYNLTWAPSLHPAAELSGLTFGGAWARDSLLPEVQRRLQARHGVSSFPYGNFPMADGAAGAPTAWETYDHRPRFGTNYYALRGRVSVLSEAYSHDPFATRVRATYGFVKELLSLAAQRGATLRAIAQRSDSVLAAHATPTIPVSAALTRSGRLGPVVWERLEPTTDTTNREPGVRRGMKRTGKFVTTTMPIRDRFTPVLQRSLPWGYVLRPADSLITRLLALHGVRLYRAEESWTGTAGPQFETDSASIAPRPFQGRREVRLHGRDALREIQVVAGAIIVPTRQPLGILAAILLEPQSDDGIVTWDIPARAASQPRDLAVLRLDRDPGVRLTRVTSPE